MSWDAYDARTLREMDDVLETIEGFLQSQHDLFAKFDKHGPFYHGEGPLPSILAGLTDSIADVKHDRQAIQDAIQDSPARQERPVEPIRV